MDEVSNLPKIGDTIKTGTLEEIMAIEGVKINDMGIIYMQGEGAYLINYDIDSLGVDFVMNNESTYKCGYLYLEGYGRNISYPIWAYQALLNKPTKQPKKSALEKELTQLKARITLVKEGIKLESEIKTGTKELKVKKARLAEIKTKGAD